MRVKIKERFSHLEQILREAYMLSTLAIHCQGPSNFQALEVRKMKSLP